MLYLKDEIFENLVMFELNRWSTEYGSNRAPREQLLGGRIWDACQKYGIKNMLALFSFGATRTLWFSTVPRDRAGQIEWAEKIGEEYARVGDIRLMSGLTLEDIKTMELVWGQATARLNEYAKFKKPVEPKLPTKPEPIPQPKPVENVKKNQDKEPEVKKESGEPKPSDKESPSTVEQQDQKSMTRKAIGAIASALGMFVAWLPVPLPVKAVLKAIFYTIGAIFK